MPILEAGLAELVAEGLDSGRLRFVVGAANAARDAEFVFLCVPTPFGDGGGADLSVVEDVVREIAPVLQPGTIIVNKSTMPVGSTRPRHPRARSERRRQRHRCRVESRVPPGGARGARLPPLQPHRDRVRRHRDRGARLRALQGHAGSTARHRSRVGRDDQVRVERVPRHQDLVRQRDRQPVRSGQRRRARGRARAWATTRASGSSSSRPARVTGSCLPKDVAALVHTAAEAGYDFAPPRRGRGERATARAGARQDHDRRGRQPRRRTHRGVGPHVQGQHRRPARLAGAGDRVPAGGRRRGRAGL